jgi:S-adenosylmethionine synthetase
MASSRCISGDRADYSPPYEVEDEPAPLQMYGRLKRDGEVATLAEQAKGAKATVLRVPVL